MKNLLKTAIASAALSFALTACGDDSGSSAELSIVYGANIDEASQTLSMYINEGTGACVKEDSNYTWKTDLLVYPDTIIYKYFFRGDTLVLQQCDNEDDEEYCYKGTMFLDGNAGSIYGKWRPLNCYYTTTETKCSDEEDFTLYYNFSANSVTISAKLSDINDSYNSVELMQSEFAYYLIKCLTESDCEVSADDLFYDYSKKVNEIIEENSIQIASSNKNSAELVISGNTVSINESEVHKNFDSNDNFETTANLTVSANDKTCTLEHYKTDTDLKSYCSVENSEYFDIDYFYDNFETLSRIDYVYAYEKSNIYDFRDCVHNLLTTTENSASATVLAKKSADADRRAIREAKERFMMQVIKANASR